MPWVCPAIGPRGRRPVGVSSGASQAAVAQLLPSIPDGSRVLTFTYDTGERYLSIDALWG